MYPNHADDPYPFSPDANQKDVSIHLEFLREYSKSMLLAYGRTAMRGNETWSDFITDFRTHTARSWTSPRVSEWRDLVTKRYIYVDEDRKTNPADSLIDILYRENMQGKMTSFKRTHRAKLPYRIKMMSNI